MNRVTFTAIIAIAISFTFLSCSGDDGGGEGDSSSSSGGKSSSSSVVPSSSSVVPSSSSVVPSSSSVVLACGEWETKTPATCESAGSKTRSCDDGSTETEPIPQLVWSDLAKVEPTCFEAGVNTRTCGGQEQSKFIDKLPSSDPSCQSLIVTIGGQVWMSRNLDVDVLGSACYDDDPANCAKYGRLYDWATAMALPGCNSKSCSDQIEEPHQGICPSGWHIPTNAEWDALFRYADGTSGTESPYDSPTAGKRLKATSGWNDWDDISGNGEDTYRFAALPGGYGYPDGYFSNAGSGYWWSASELDSYVAYRRSMSYYYENAYWDYNSKTNLYSVRCLQD